MSSQYFVWYLKESHQTLLTSCLNLYLGEMIFIGCHFYLDIIKVTKQSQKWEVK